MTVPASAPSSARRGFSLQRVKQRSEMPLIITPTSHRSHEQRLPHLPTARGHDRALRLVEIQAGGLPRQTEKTDQPAAFGFQAGNQRFIADRHHPQRQDTAPMFDQPRGFAVAYAAIG